MCLENIAGHTNTHTPRCWISQSITFSSDLRKSSLVELAKACLPEKKRILFFDKNEPSSALKNTCKQNEKVTPTKKIQ